MLSAEPLRPVVGDTWCAVHVLRIPTTLVSSAGQVYVPLKSSSLQEFVTSAVRVRFICIAGPYPGGGNRHAAVSRPGTSIGIRPIGIPMGYAAEKRKCGVRRCGMGAGRHVETVGKNTRICSSSWHVRQGRHEAGDAAPRPAGAVEEAHERAPARTPRPSESSTTSVGRALRGRYRER